LAERHVCTHIYTFLCTPARNTEPTLTSAHRLERTGNANNRYSENQQCTVHSSELSSDTDLMFYFLHNVTPVPRWTRSDVSVKLVLSNIYDATSHKVVTFILSHVNLIVQCLLQCIPRGRQSVELLILITVKHYNMPSLSRNKQLHVCH
jgi:hypothetical protein